MSVTLAREDVPIPVALRLFLPEGWALDEQRRRKAFVPDYIVHRPKWRIALEEIERIHRSGVRFADVLADAGYGSASGFRAGLSLLGLNWAVGVLSTQSVYRPDVALTDPPTTTRQGRPAKHPIVSERHMSVAELVSQLGPGIFRVVTWRQGSQGALRGRFAALRVRPADGDPISRGIHLPGDEVWLVVERRAHVA